MSREIFKNNPSTALSADITSTSATSISVDDGSVFPSTGEFRILIGSELMLVTARSTNTLTVVRGIEGTTATTHSTSDGVNQIVTAGALRQYGRDNSPGFDGSLPPFRLLDGSGNVLDSSDFTVVNASDTVINDQDGTISFRMIGGGATIKVTALARTAPATPNALIAGMQFIFPTNTAGRWVHTIVGFRESSSGKITAITLYNDSTNGGLVLAVNRYDSVTSLNSTVFAKTVFAMCGSVVWFKAVDNGTNLILYIGDGREWIQVYTEARTSFLTGGADQIIAGANCGGNGFDSITRLVAWQE